VSASSLVARSLEVLAHLSAGVLAGLVLVAAGQPLQTDDAWWHLALGRAYARSGPLLAADPLLHTAPGPPAPAAWLADLALFAAGSAGGFAGLRVAHLCLVAGILALAWSLLRRASGSRSAASLGVGVFAALAAYRLFQLRPELGTILATLVLYRLLLEDPAPPSRRRVGLAALLLGLWANAHSGFLLGPLLLAAALGGLALAAALGPASRRQRERARASRLAAALGLGLLATLANPGGLAQHLAYFRAGAQTPELAQVADEWARLDLFRLPLQSLPPSPLAWGIAWALLALVLGVAARAVARWRRGDGGEADDADPALVAVAGASLVALLSAVRFLWLGIFPLLLAARAARAGFGARAGGGRAAAGAIAAAGALLVVGFLRLGDWRMISWGIPSAGPGWAQPYPAGKYHAHAVWFLADAELEGNLFNDYFLGGFLGYWLAPELRAFVNGSLNVEVDALKAYGALRDRRGLPGADFLELLDRYRVDLFVGVRLPQLPEPGRPWIYSTGHLEGAPGWVPVFRDLRSAVYLRTNARHPENLERVADYYARAGVPFDPQQGFDPARAIREAPAWAVAHGLVPVDFSALEATSHSPDPSRRRGALDRLASLYAALGLYEQAVRIDRRLLRSSPTALAPRRRLVWSLLRLRRGAEALEAAEALARAPAQDTLCRAIASAARRYATLGDADEAARLAARLPVLTAAEADGLLAGVAAPAPRPWRR
jgi:hypothetical protein